LIRCEHQEFRDVRLDWQFLDCGWVLLSVAVEHDLQAR
jgi:hypothetical protein